MTYRKTPCNICGCNIIKVDRGFSMLGERVKEVYDEYCSGCGQLLYGYSRLLPKGSAVPTLNEVTKYV